MLVGMPRLAPLFWIITLGAAPFADLTPVRTIDLRGDTHHPQGIDFDEQHVWVTSVDRAQRKGYLQEFSLTTGEHLRTADVTKGDQYHPGGFSARDGLLWIPVAEYRPASSAVIQKRNIRTLELESEFEVMDHIGCVAAAPDVLIGGNWDSRDFYIWDYQGRLLRKVASPTGNSYQDLKFVDGRLMGAGSLPDQTGAVDWLEYPSLRLLRRVTTGRTSRGVSYTNEGMAIRGDRIFFLPENSPSRLFEFRLAVAGQ
jgi:hypothetical protein